MTSDEQEALSRVYSDDIIILLPLRSGRVAVFNSARTLCGMIHKPEPIRDDTWPWWKELMRVWHKPAATPKPSSATPSLEELGL